MGKEVEELKNRISELEKRIKDQDSLLSYYHKELKKYESAREAMKNILNLI